MPSKNVSAGIAKCDVKVCKGLLVLYADVAEEREQLECPSELNLLVVPGFLRVVANNRVSERANPLTIAVVIPFFSANPFTKPSRSSPSGTLRRKTLPGLNSIIPTSKLIKPP